MNDETDTGRGGAPFEVPLAGGGALSGEVAGEGSTLVLLHGLTATRRYVVQGSRYLERHGHRIVSYDARGHGRSSAAPGPDAYEYADLVSDLERVLDDLELRSAVLVGSSMGAATALAFALRRPQRVEALVQITPASRGGATADEEELERWDRLAAGLRERGVDGFLDAYDPPVADVFRDAVTTHTRQRLEGHDDLGAVADAIEVVPRSTAWEGGVEALAGIDAPTLVVASRDEADPGHPLAVGEEYAEAIPGAELVVEDEGESPLAWRGAQLSREIGRFLERALG